MERLEREYCVRALADRKVLDIADDQMRARITDALHRDVQIRAGDVDANRFDPALRQPFGRPRISTAAVDGDRTLVALPVDAEQADETAEQRQQVQAELGVVGI